MQISIIVPTLDEAAVIERTLLPLQVLRQQGHEIVIADGGSADHTAALAAPLADKVIRSAKGRALQMNSGAQAASGGIFLFLHADTVLPVDAIERLAEQMRLSGNVWGRFDVRLSGERFMFRVIERMMNWRSRLTAVATGDQAIFVLASAFAQVGGFDEIPLMEDISLSKKLRRVSAPLCLKARVITSSRRWERLGVWRTIGLMWRLRFLYFVGVSPAELAVAYRTAVR